MNINVTESYYLKLYLNSSKYFNKCWLKRVNNLSADQEQMIDIDFVYSDAESLLAGIVNVLQSGFGATLNFLILFILLRNPKLRNDNITPSIISIAITDFLFCAYPLPAISVHWFTKDWPLPFGCQFYSFVLYGLWLCSAWNLLGITAIRCVAVYFPMMARRNSFRPICKVVPVMAWIITTISLLPTLVGKYGQFGFECRTFKCKFINVDREGNPTKSDPERTYASGIILLGIVILFLNIAIFIRVSKQSKKVAEQFKLHNLEIAKQLIDKERRVGRIIKIVTISFFVVYFPMIILRMNDSNAMVTKPKAYIACYLFTCMIGIIDPLVYIIGIQKYRSEIKRLFFKPKDKTKPLVIQKLLLTLGHEEEDYSSVNLRRMSVKFQRRYSKNYDKRKTKVIILNSNE